VLVVLVLMVLGWLLIHGQVRGLYASYAVQGTPPAAASPVGEAGRSQLGPWAYFWSERAFHYRTTLMFAVDDGPSPGVLARDTDQQHPDGVDAWREYTLCMEPVYGWLYRLLGGEREILAEFLTRLVPLVHVLMFLAIYGLARGLGARPLLAAGAVLVTATCTLGFSRMAGSLLLKETFTLTWLVAFSAAHVWAVRRQSTALLLLAAALLVLVLVSWHLGQFLVLVVLGAAAVGQVTARRRAPRWSLQVALTYLVAAVVAGTTPSLRARDFFLSLPMMILVAWTLMTLVQWRRPERLRGPWRAGAVFAGLVVALGGLSLLNRQFTGDYNHVFGLLAQKIAHRFAYPEDPAALPFDVRVFWAPPFTAPGWSDIWRELGWHAVSLGLAVAAGAVLVASGRFRAPQRALMLQVLAFLGAWLLFERLGLVVLPYAAVLLAVVAEHAARELSGRWQQRGWPPRRAGTAAATVAIALVAWTPVANLADGMSVHIRRAADGVRGAAVFPAAATDARNWFRGDLLRWLLQETPGRGSRWPGAAPRAVVAGIGASPAILLYTGRPVVLNSQFENQPIRRRYEKYLGALFGTDPDALRRFLAEVDAGYLVIGRNDALGMGPGSLAYQAGVQGPLSLERTLLRLHFAPESLDFLQPVWDSEYYRVFAVGPRPAGPVTWDRKHASWWNPERFTIRGGRLVDPAGDRRRLQGFEQQLVALQDAQAEVLRHGDENQLRGLHQQYVAAQLQVLQAEAAAGSDLADLADLVDRRDRLAAAIGAHLGARDPRTGRTLAEALAALLTEGPTGGGPGWREVLTTGLAEPTHLAAVADLLSLLGQYGQAADAMTEAASRLPLLPTVLGNGEVRPVASPLAQRMRHAAVWLNLGAGRLAEACDLARRFAPWTAPGSAQEQFFRHVAGLGGS